MQIHHICITDNDYDSILDEIERREKLSLKIMLVLIVTIYSTDVNNNNAILNVVVNYIMIKYLYLNVIWLFIPVRFYLCV